MVTIHTLSPLTVSSPAGSPSALSMQRNRSGSLRKGNRSRSISVKKPSHGSVGSPVGRGRKVSFYEGPRAPGPATSVMSSPIVRASSFSNSILKKTPTTATIDPSEGLTPMVFPTTVTDPGLPSTKRGYLNKYSLGRSRFLGRRNWRERWFEATPMGLAYYKQNTDRNFVYEVRFGPKDPRQCSHCTSMGRGRYTVYDCDKCNSLNNSNKPPTFLRPSLSGRSFPYLDRSQGDVYFGLSFWQSGREFTLVMQASDAAAKAQWVQFLHQYSSIHEEALGLGSPIRSPVAASPGPMFEEMNLESSCGSSSSTSLDFTATTTDPELTPTTPLMSGVSSFSRLQRVVQPQSVGVSNSVLPQQPRRASIIRTKS
eukprot:TRINITY_DN473_c2_g1_i1.p1 TRINITY_DN473_c2_g1~~TRINITY_DN473_c2_g1_i1.p1  ORF type:complete len:369 (+),score=-6.80 TRINITY_DN473_c2_g1_i1:165-1271(+)